MSIYKKIAAIGPRFISKDKLFKYGFNLSPMYRRSTGRITDVSKDLYSVKVKIPISWKNKNYMNSIFGGSLFAAVDPIPMVQLINIIGDEYIVWDKAAEIVFKKPARENVFAVFNYTDQEITEILKEVSLHNEIVIQKETNITNHDGSVLFCKVSKTIYIVTKEYYKTKKSASNIRKNT